MAEFYLWTREVTYLVTLLFAFCVLSQSLATLASFYRYSRNRVRNTETLLELFILCYVFVCSLLHGQTREAYGINILAPTGYGNSRIIIFTLIAVLAIAAIVQIRKMWPLLTIAAASLTLPLSEELAGNVFAYIYIVMILFWLIRSILISFWRYREIRTGISELSIKHSIDALNTGVLFCDQDGFILLANTRMQRLMITITGKIQRNGRQFYSLLTLGEIDSACGIKWVEGQIVISLPDSSAWKINITDLTIKRKKYKQITATDISEQWKLTVELQSQNEELKKRQDELNRIITNLNFLSRERVTQKAKMRAHDILGERLTLLLSTLRSERTPDYALLRTLSQGLIDDLRSAENSPSPQDELTVMKQTFESIGVEILFDGNLPEEGSKGQLVADIAREAITNAVRHGFATQVYIHMDESDGGFHLRITDNGHSSYESIREGGGISGMREKVKPFGGAFNVAAHPRFALTVDLPRGENNA